MNAEYYGVMTMPSDAYKGPIYNLQSLMKYCFDNKKNPEELSYEEKSLFEVKCDSEAASKELEEKLLNPNALKFDSLEELSAVFRA